MKREIYTKVSCLLLAGMVLAGCGEKTVSDDMDTEEAIEYAYGLLEENKDSSADDLYDDMVDDAIEDFMGDLENGEEITELPDGLNLKQLVEIQKEHPELVKRTGGMIGGGGGDYSDDPLDYFVFQDYKMTREYLETTPISQQIADLYNNVEWERAGVSIGQCVSDIDPDEKVDLSDAEEVKKWLEEKLSTMNTRSEDIYIYYVYFETEDCSYADRLYFTISAEDITAEETNSYMVLDYTCHACGAGAAEDWTCCCFSRKEDGKYYLFNNHEQVFAYRYWTGKDL